MSTQCPSCIRGYHVYQEVWTPYVGEIITSKRQPLNVKDRYAVSTPKMDGEVVGHLPRKVSKIFSLFLCHGGVITCEVTGSRKRSTDLVQGGLEVPCLLRIKGNKKDVSTFKKLLSK